MASMIEVKAKGRNKLASKVLNEINSIGQDRIISIVDQGPDGKIAGGGLLANYKAYIFYKD